ncbi:undecaprenyl-phosphate glucose phosphotransferase [Polynucleobacter sp. UB-Piko-W3]|nr:undecaprenyl-phosphate glucose phosphotransferase [Polynucleobacter sp. UB-Piko-W3]MBU3555995.1 undecaprenyl-phosphate glucose phosphotransferase [Polynucleobacter sp. UB-Piko-W3]
MLRLGDGLVILVSGLLALNIRQVLNLPIEFPSNLSGYYSLIAVGALLFSTLSGGVYRSWRGALMPAMLARITGRWLLVVGIILLWLFIFKTSSEFSRVWFGVWVSLGVILLWIERLALYVFLRVLRRRGFNLRHVAIIGSGSAAKNLESRISSAGWSGYSLSKVIANTDKAELEQLAKDSVDEIWLALPLGNETAIRDTLHALRHSTASIRFAPDLFTLRLVNHGVSDILGIPMYDLSTSPMTGVNQFLKWCEDKILSSLILLLISPIMLILAIGVKLSSPGPVFYRQERIGLNGATFNMLKFRSMPVDTEKFGVQWGGSAAKATSRFGQLIRKTSLDELPQFLNVLSGDMSIVGPRPERPMFVEQFKEEIPDYMKKHLVKAGITGWAQVNGWRGDTDLATRIEYDLYYIENWSIGLDLKIILLTVFKGFVSKNAY